MATIGLDSLYYAEITEAQSAGSGSEIGDESYGAPKRLAKAISAEISVELAEAILYADDGPAETVKEFSKGTVSLGVDDIGTEAAAVLTGAAVDANGVLVASSEDVGKYVAIGFRAKKANGKYRYFWLYKVRFSVPNTSLNTKGESVEFSTPTIEGTVLRRNKANEAGKHPWKAEITDDGTTAVGAVCSSWFTGVYEPDFDTEG